MNISPQNDASKRGSFASQIGGINLSLEKGGKFQQFVAVSCWDWGIPGPKNNISVDGSEIRLTTRDGAKTL